MVVALHLVIELEKFNTDYKNLDSYVMDIVNRNWEENQFEITVDGKLVRHEIDMDETEYYILKTEYLLNAIVIVNEEIADVDGFVSKMEINDFMINSHMENKMFNVKIKNVRVKDYCEMELV
ncbi:hypothetical protein M3649_04235 [Ureibacillus chungkukjangi]|uniref:hypothetical protein n=1 Tax=Ureibacillus chungkukjangi TaxID=1202712 RepID=UPI0020417EDB|nr:hypothetical protein [Ureibacillus chungkukjangi]MCM3387342.1 hypothetical protein [Ureibacillus chungkukjangi]